MSPIRKILVRTPWARMAMHPKTALDCLSEFLNGMSMGFSLVRDFAVDYPTTMILALQICILCMLCFILCRRGRGQELRQQADEQSAVPTVAVHVKVEGSTVTISNPNLPKPLATRLIMCNLVQVLVQRPAAQQRVPMIMMLACAKHQNHRRDQPQSMLLGCQR